jgi:hypothetical protein
VAHVYVLPGIVNAGSSCQDAALSVPKACGGWLGCQMTSVRPTALIPRFTSGLAPDHVHFPYLLS